MIRRGWFQLHLSTCIALMFAAGGILYLNMPVTTRTSNLPDGEFFLAYKEVTIDAQNNERVSPRSIFIGREVTRQGWPCLVRLCDFDEKFEGYLQFGALRLPQTTQTIAGHDGSWRLWAANGFIALLILAAIACACEWFLRRRERRKQTIE